MYEIEVQLDLETRTTTQAREKLADAKKQLTEVKGELQAMTQSETTMQGDLQAARTQLQNSHIESQACRTEMDALREKLSATEARLEDHGATPCPMCQWIS